MDKGGKTNGQESWCRCTRPLHSRDDIQDKCQKKKKEEEDTLALRIA